MMINPYIAVGCGLLVLTLGCAGANEPNIEKMQAGSYKAEHKTKHKTVGVCHYPQRNEQVTVKTAPVSENKSQLFIQTKGKVHSQTMHEDMFDLSGLPSITLTCQEDGFYIEYVVQLFSTYASYYDLFGYSPQQGAFTHNNHAAIYATKDSLLVVGINISHPAAIESYDIGKVMDLKTELIIDFEGYMREKEPDMNIILALVKEKYQAKDHGFMYLLSDMLKAGILQDNIRVTKENIAVYRQIAAYLEKAGMLPGEITLYKYKI